MTNIETLTPVVSGLVTPRLIANSTNPKHTTCPLCQTTFIKRRRNQSYCSDNCRKGSQKKRDRAINPVNSTFSAGKYRDNMVFFDRSLRLAELYYTTVPTKRLGLLKDLVDAARNNEQPIKSILTNQVILRASKDEKNLFFRKAPTSYRTIAQLADQYCRKFWGHSVIYVVKGPAPEPDTGEVLA